MAQIIPDDPNLNALALMIFATTDVDPGKRKQAEEHLKQAEASPGFPLMLLKLGQHPAAAPVRQAAAVAFKNLVKRRWRRQNEIAEEEKAQIKTHIVNLMLSSPPDVRKQLAAALTIISEADFPGKWESLLPELIARLKTPDPNVINGVLRVLHSILKRYQGQSKNPTVLKELKYVLDLFAEPLLRLYQQVCGTLGQTQDIEAQCVLFTALNTMSKIFYSLNCVDLPEFFEDHLEEWIVEFHKLLSFRSNVSQLMGSEEDKPGILPRVQAAIAKSLDIYVEKYEEEIEKFLQVAVADVWALLTTLGPEPKFDKLIAACISVLIKVSKSSFAPTLFADPNALRNICQNVVIPNVQFRACDEEAFKFNPQEYIRSDIEGSDTDTRRRAACELVTGLRKQFEVQITEITAAYIDTMLKQFASDPKAHWKQKDAAMYLISALAVSASTRAGGAVQVNPLVPILPFFASHVMPEMQNRTNSILEADALKFTFTFRAQLPREVGLTLFPIFAKLLQSDKYVVHSYAALCIERFLMLKVNGQPMYSREDLKPSLAGFIVGLFKQLNTQDSKDNEYIMRAIVQVIVKAGEDILPFVPDIIKGLSAVLSAAARNPVSPDFNHYMFEALGALIKGICTSQPQLVPQFEAALLPAFQFVLQQDISDFLPYTFQLLALLLELHPTGALSPFYTAMFPTLLVPALYARTALIPAVVRLLQAYIRKAGSQVAASGHLESVLGVFQKLLASNIYDHEAFYIIEALVQYLKPEELQQYISQVFMLCFQRMQSLKTHKFVRSFNVFLCLFVSVHGGNTVWKCIDSIQPGLFRMVLEKLLISDVRKVSGNIERKICAIGITKLLTETEWPNDYLPLWPTLMTTLLNLIEMPQEEAHDDIPEHIDDEDVGNKFAALAYGGKIDTDPFPGVDARKFLAAQLHRLCGSQPGRFDAALRSIGAPAEQQLRNYFAQSALTYVH